MRMLPRTLLMIALAAPAEAQTTLFEYQDGTEFDFFGHAVDGAGDFDGDGVADVIVGAVGDDAGGSGNGSARVYSGKNSAVLLHVTGSFFANLGASVAGVSDLNGDGFAEVLIGAQFDKSVPPGRGTARVYAGLTGVELFVFAGATLSDDLGRAVGSAGDVNGDGVPDLLVGLATGSKVFSGSDGALLRDLPTGGYSVTVAGDVDGDGFVDLIVGDRTGAVHGALSGTAVVYSGPSGAVLHTFHGDGPLDSLGESVDGASDIDGDGRDDVIVGASQSVLFGSSGGGYARVLSGATGGLLYQVTGAVNDQLGRRVVGGADFDRDGVPDFVVSGPSQALGTNKLGSVRVYSGATGLSLHSLAGSAVGDGFGAGLGLAGDIDQNGFPDLVIGAPNKPLAGTNTGVAYVVSFCDGAVIPYGDGCGAGGAPDLDVPGCPLAGGALPIAIGGGPASGSALLFAGLSQATLPMGFGCELLVNPPLGPLGPLPLDGAGSLSFTAGLPPAFSGITFSMQAFFSDPGSPIGFTNSNGVELQVP